MDAYEKEHAEHLTRAKSGINALNSFLAMLIEFAL